MFSVDDSDGEGDLIIIEKALGGRKRSRNGRFDLDRPVVKRKIEDDARKEDGDSKLVLHPPTTGMLDLVNSQRPSRGPLFQNLCFWIIPSGITPVQQSLLEDAVRKRGGTLVQGITNETTHVVTALRSDALRKRALTAADRVVPIVTPEFISKSIQSGKVSDDISQSELVEVKQIQGPNLQLTEETVKADSDEEKTKKPKTLITRKPDPPLTREKSAAFHAWNDIELSSEAGTDDEPYIPAREKSFALEEEILSSETEPESDLTEDEETVEKTPVGKKLRNQQSWACMRRNPTILDDGNRNEHITKEFQLLVDRAVADGDEWRIISYRKAINILKKHKEITSVKDVEGIRGIGPQMRKKIEEDFLERIPREECTAILHFVEQVVATVDPDIECTMMGSYRRGSPSCGDVDFILTHPDGVSHEGLLPKVLAALKKTNFIIDDLSNSHTSSNEDHPIYKGVCRLEGGSGTARRIDILVVPYSELGAALIYFTGNEAFNRSIRHLAHQKHGLWGDVIRDGRGEKKMKGTLIASRTEQPDGTSSQIGGLVGASNGVNDNAIEEEAKLVYGVVFSLRNVVNKLVAGKPSSEGFLSYRTNNYKLHYLEKASGLSQGINDIVTMVCIDVAK
ncbi:hypothetical protein HDU76_010304 [Blyttiomyces sp. JEL0837]|nr:hypothetical protein HDU76_010304 [Blyttiomyces sp. JEL0837]